MSSRTIDSGTARKLDTSTFTGDAWAVQATLDVPPAAVPRFVARGPVRWSLVAMAGEGDDASPADDVVTVAEVRAVKLSLTPAGEATVRTVDSATGVACGVDLTEDDIARGDVFVLAVPELTTGVGSAPWIWVVLHGGATALEDGAGL